MNVNMDVNMNRLLGARATDLPEDILKHKWAGHFGAAGAAISARLGQDSLPAVLRSRLMIEQVCLERLCSQYPFTREQAIAALRLANQMLVSHAHPA